VIRLQDGPKEMSQASKSEPIQVITDFEEFIQLVDYSLMNNLNADPESSMDGDDHSPRQVRSGHFVTVTTQPIENPTYVIHSRTLFKELGLGEQLAVNEDFQKLFSGDISVSRKPMRPFGWATGYALSIYGTEYNQQCPFGNGNGYGDGRAISVFEGIFKGNRWEMQLKGAGPTPYCRGADGRAVLRSSVREFLAQELMQALGVPTTRSLSLYVSKSETVRRPWYSENSISTEPDILVEDPVAISTRVASSFLRVGQLELFARRARKTNNPEQLEELRLIISHLIEREYRNEIDPDLEFEMQLIRLAQLYQERLSSLMADWLRIGFCQGNFNSDNCAAGGFTIDYGPFGFCENFDPHYQPWIGGGEHFSYFNQPLAAEANYQMFWKAIRLILIDNTLALEQLDKVFYDFKKKTTTITQNMWASKLGLDEYNHQLFMRLVDLMMSTTVDFTIFFRELSYLPHDLSTLRKSFYDKIPQQLEVEWQDWIQDWHDQLNPNNDHAEISRKMKLVNPKYIWREWLIAPAYEQAKLGNFALIKELQEVFSDPYNEQSQEIEAKYYRLKPEKYFHFGGISFYSCSS